MHAQALAPEPFHRLPALIGRLPLPSEAATRLPPSLRRALGLRISPRQLFAAAVPGGLLLGWLASFAVDPEMIQRGGKPYIARLDDGVQVELAAPFEGYPIDPAPFGYGPREMPPADYLNAGIADAGAYAEGLEPDGREAVAAPVSEVEAVEAESPPPEVAVAPAPAPAARPVIQVVPQDTPL